MNRTLTHIVLLLLVPLLVACAAAGPDAELPDVESGDADGAEGEAPLQGDEDADMTEPDATEESEEEAAGAGGDALELAGTSWRLVSLNEEQPLEDTEITLEFTETDAAGNAGCNHYSGTYTLEGDELTVEEIISTMMACMEPEGVMEQETAYHGALQSVATARLVADEQLILLDESGSPVLTYVKQQPPVDAELEGTQWVLESFLSGDAVSSTIFDTTLTATFENGEITGDAGCNGYGGTYTVEGDSLTTAEIVSTMMACDEPEGIMDQEAQFLGLLNSAENYEIEGDTLTIMSGDDQGLVFRAE